MPTSKAELIEDSIIFLDNLFEVSITIKISEIISKAIETSVITKTFDVIENVEESLGNPEHEKEFV